MRDDRGFRDVAQFNYLSPIERFPDNILANIFKNLSLTTIKTISHVSKRFYTILTLHAYREHLNVMFSQKIKASKQGISDSSSRVSQLLRTIFSEQSLINVRNDHFLDLAIVEDAEDNMELITSSLQGHLTYWKCGENNQAVAKFTILVPECEILKQVRSLGQHYLLAKDKKECLHIFKLHDAQPTYSINAYDPKNMVTAYELVPLEEGFLLALAKEDMSVELRDPITKEKTQTLMHDFSPNLLLAFKDNGISYLVSMSKECSVTCYIWQIAPFQEEPLFTIESELQNHISSIEKCTINNTLCLVISDVLGNIEIWDLSTQQLRFSIPCPTGAGTEIDGENKITIIPHPSMNVLAQITDEHKIHLWNLSEQKPIASFNTNKERFLYRFLKSVVIDNRVLLLCGANAVVHRGYQTTNIGQVFVWDVSPYLDNTRDLSTLFQALSVYEGSSV